MLTIVKISFVLDKLLSKNLLFFAHVNIKWDNIKNFTPQIKYNIKYHNHLPILQKKEASKSVADNLFKVIT